jgi:TonB-linked SusC/RagA family outer membrane protein
MRKALCYGRKAEFISHSFTKGDGLQKLLRIMRLMMILLTAACFSAAARGYTQGISLNMKNTPLDKVFAAIEKQTGYYFTYTREILQGTRNVDVDVQNAAIKDVMNICVKGQPVMYEILEKAIVIRRRGERLTKDIDLNSIGDVLNVPIDVHGRVVNEKGEPVAGVTVTIKGTNKSTSTNDNGEFTLSGTKADDVLVFTSVDMEAFQIKVGDKSELTINLKTKVTALGAVEVKINTGYQQINKERFVGSVTTIDSSLFHREISTDFLSRLDGITNGVLFQKNGGQLIMIRNISTIDPLSNYAPLIILDDFPYTGDINNINPNEIENITILKDAAAASIWGSRAGNGVIVVTTKKGKYNQPLQLSYNTNFRLQEKPDPFYLSRITTSDFIDVEELLFSKGFYDANLSNTTTYPAVPQVAEILNKVRNGKLSMVEAEAQINSLRSLDVRNDYNKYLLRDQMSQQHFLSVGGGNSVAKYNFSLGYDHGLSASKGDGNKGANRYTISTNASFKPFKVLEITTGINLTHSVSTTGTIGQSISRISPYTRLADAFDNPLPVDKDYRTGYTDTAGGGKLLDWKYRPLQEIGLANNTSKIYYYNINTGLSLKLTSWLTASVKFQYGQQTGSAQNFKARESYEVRNLVNLYTRINGSTVGNGIPLGEILDLSNNESRNYNLRGQLSFNRNFNATHDISAIVAADASEVKSGSNSSRIYGYDDQTGSYSTFIDHITLFPQYVGGGAARIPNTLSFSDGNIRRVVSLLANMSYTYHNRYTVYASARRDGANVFGVKTNEKWKPLWSVGASWDILKESFLQLDWLSSLQLKASYGYSGNLPAIAGGGTKNFVFSYGGSLSPFTNLPYASAGATRSSVRWEKVGMLNIGFGFSTKNARISGGIDWFKKKSTDLIADIPVDPTVGLLGVTIKQNVANLTGHGIDITIATKNLTGLLQWTTSFNFSHSKMIVTKYFLNRTETSTSIGINPREGALAFGIYSYRWGGLDPLTGDPLGYIGKSLSKNYQNIFADSLQNQIFHGSSVPLYFGNILNSFSWKGFSISFNISYRFDFYFRKPTISYAQFFGDPSNASGDPDFYKRWKNPGDEKITSVPSMSYPAGADRDRFYKYSEVNVVRGDNIRLQDFRIDFPSWVNKRSHIPLKRAQFYIYPGNINILLWKKNKTGLDPDYSGDAYSPHPPMTWAAGINVNF